MRTAILFARKDSIYKQLPRTDVYDLERDARTFTGGRVVIAHPPCRAWGRLRTLPEREATPEPFALWLLEVCNQIRTIQNFGVAA